MNAALWVALAVAVVGGLGGGAALLKTFFDQPKNKADAVKILSDTAFGQLDKIVERNDDLEERVDQMETKLAAAVAELTVTKEELRKTAGALQEAKTSTAQLRDAVVMVVADNHKLREMLADAKIHAPENLVDMAKINKLLRDIPPPDTWSGD